MKEIEYTNKNTVKTCINIIEQELRALKNQNLIENGNIKKIAEIMENIQIQTRIAKIFLKEPWEEPLK